MYLVMAEREAEKRRGGRVDQATIVGGLAGLMLRGWRWWKERELAQQRRTAKKQLFLLETIVLGPKQRVVLMRCGGEHFLVGMGAEGVTSVVRVGDGSEPQRLPLAAGGGGAWG